jgi:hypothetical protein
MAEKNLFIYIFVRLGLEPYNICTNPETGETPLEGRLCVYILHYIPFEHLYLKLGQIVVN